jgi:hypothetical protein
VEEEEDRGAAKGPPSRAQSRAGREVTSRSFPGWMGQALCVCVCIYMCVCVCICVCVYV